MLLQLISLFKLLMRSRKTQQLLVWLVQALGAAILPQLAAEPIPKRIQVCSLPIPLKRVIGVAVLANALPNPAVFAFLNTLRVEQLISKAAVLKCRLN